MKILILGSDGYIGYPLTFHLLKKGHTVFGIDNLSRRKRVREVDSDSLTPIASTYFREDHLMKEFSAFGGTRDISLGIDSPVFLKNIIHYFKPDAIVHLAEQPSAAWSMSNIERATKTQLENVIGTLHLLWAMKDECPEAHLVKLGSMGEYGTPDCEIPEGRIPATCIANSKLEDNALCGMAGLMFPRTANSFYHLSKVHDSHNIEFACRTWNLRSTDIMQGIVFGLSDDCITRFDYDEYFGTVINRFCVQAIINMPLTIYGSGEQTRGILTLNDSIKCLTLALENPPGEGEYRTFNQFGGVYSINAIAMTVQKSAQYLGIPISFKHLDNPRSENETHYYSPSNDNLINIGYNPADDFLGDVAKVINKLLPLRDRVIRKVILPKTTWR